MARKFDGNLANFLSSALAYNLPSDWTILFRVKNVVSTGDHQIFFGRRGGDTNGWAVGRQSGGQFTFWGFGGTTGSAGNVTLGSAGFEAYAITREAVGSLGTFYKDSTTPLGTASITPGASATQGLYFGNMNSSGTAAFPANCELAEVAIFSRVLSSAELAQWFAGDSPSLYNTGLVHYWKLDAASGNESATTGGATLTQVGTVTATTHPAMNYGATNASDPGGTGTSTGSSSGGDATGGSGGTNASDPGGTGTSTGSGSGGTAIGGGAGTFTFDACENNSHSGPFDNVAVNWAWHSGGNVGAGTTITNGTGTMTTSGMTISGLPAGVGYGVIRSADGTVVAYQEGTVS